MGIQQMVNGLHNSGNTNWGLLQLDFSNAFNCVSRDNMLREVADRCPPMLPWMESCYSRHSQLYLGPTSLRSKRGVQQGDPCGPATFAISVQSLLDSLQAQVGWQGWYLDDAHVLGTPDQLEQAVRTILRDGPAIGVSLNADKCSLWGPAFSDRAEGLLQPIPVVPFKSGSGIRALGIPIIHPSGDGTFATHQWEERLASVHKACELLQLVPSPHIQFTVLRQCLDSCKVNDLLRATPLPLAKGPCHNFTSLLRDTMGVVVSRPLEETQWVQTTLPVRLGGLGIRDPEVIRVPAGGLRFWTS
jgi:hypothetical protein